MLSNLRYTVATFTAALWVAALVVVAGEPDGAGSSERALVQYLESLACGEYDDAVDLVDERSWKILQQWNPTMAQSDSVALLRQGCMGNGLNCLHVRDIVERSAAPDGVARFVVEFDRANGSRFVRGPCCGSSDPPDSQFVFEVENIGGGFVVHGLPPYTP